MGLNDGLCYVNVDSRLIEFERNMVNWFMICAQYTAWKANYDVLKEEVRDGTRWKINFMSVVELHTNSRLPVVCFVGDGFPFAFKRSRLDA